MFLTEDRSDATASEVSSSKFFPDKLTKIEDHVLLTEESFSSIIKPPFENKFCSDIDYQVSQSEEQEESNYIDLKDLNVKVDDMIAGRKKPKSGDKEITNIFNGLLFELK